MSIFKLLNITNIDWFDQTYHQVLIESNLAEKLTMKAPSFDIIWQKVYGMMNDFLQMLPILFLGLCTFVIFFIVGKIVRVIIKRIMLNRRHYNVGLVLARIAQWLLILIGLLITFAIVFPSVTTADILAGLGLGSIAIGFAFKDILGNYLAGIFILLNEPFKIGDEIKYKEFEGVVEFIDNRTTFLKSYDGRRILIPNGEIYKNTITVNTAYKQRCTEYDIGIGCSDDLQKAADVILSALNNIEDVMKYPKPEVLVISLDEYKNILRARWWTTPHQIDILRIKNKVLKLIKQQMHDAAIDLPFPTEVVLWHDQTEEIDGDRAKQREGWPSGKYPPKANTLASAITNKVEEIT